MKYFAEKLDGKILFYWAMTDDELKNWKQRFDVSKTKIEFLENVPESSKIKQFDFQKPTIKSITFSGGTAKFERKTTYYGAGERGRKTYYKRYNHVTESSMARLRKIYAKYRGKTTRTQGGYCISSNEIYHSNWNK